MYHLDNNHEITIKYNQNNLSQQRFELDRAYCQNKDQMIQAFVETPQIRIEGNNLQ
jgi:hypothetical protein